MSKRPFFTRFIEKQAEPELATDLRAGNRGTTPDTTLRYPSDNEGEAASEFGRTTASEANGGMTTLRYPSDEESSEIPIKV